jgi:hypothetical protein
MKLFIWANNLLLPTELVTVAAITVTFCSSRKGKLQLKEDTNSINNPQEQ